MTPKKWSERLFILLLIGVPVSIFALGLMIPAANELLYSNIEFDADRWKNGDAQQRMRMAADLVHSRKLIGKNRQEVMATLGPPDFGPELLEYRIVHGDVLSFFEWEERLHIRIAADDGKVTEVNFFD